MDVALGTFEPGEEVALALSLCVAVAVVGTLVVAAQSSDAGKVALAASCSRVGTIDALQFTGLAGELCIAGTDTSLFALATT